MYFLIPESPRWLIETGKRRRVEDLLIKAGKINGYEIKLPEDLHIEELDEYSSDEDDGKSVASFVSGMREEVKMVYGPHSNDGLFHPAVRYFYSIFVS